MRALLRADWLRIRRRRDLWIIGIAVLLFSAVGYLAEYQQNAVDPSFPTQAEIRQQALTDGYFEGATQAEIDQQLDQYVADQVAMFDQQRAEWEVQQEVALQHFDLAQSPFTLLGSALIPTLALVLAASLIVGDEFRFGTIRTSLLAAGDRRRFLAARLVTLTLMTAALFAALVALGLVLGIALRAFGGDVRSAPAVALLPGLGWLGAEVIGAMILVILATMLTVLLRSGALPLLLILLGAFSELFVLSLPIFRPGEFLAGVPQAFLSNSVRTLTARLGYDSHALALSDAQIPTSVIELPIIVLLAIIAAWASLFLVIADRRFRRMDVVE